MRRKILTSIMVGTLLVSSLVVGASEIEKKVLTLEQATRYAKATSMALEQNERQATLQGEEAENASLLYGHQAYIPYHVSRQYTQEQRSVIDKQIERSVRQLFDTILLHQQELQLIQKEIELGEKRIREVEIKKSLGMASELEVEKVNQQYNDLLESKEEMKLTLGNFYTEFEVLTNYSLERYTLEEIENTYKAFTFPGSLDALAGLRAEKSIDLWMANQQVELENLPMYTTDYLTRLKKEESRLQAEENVEITKDSLKEAIRSTYLALKQVEENYVLMLQSLELQQKGLEQQAIYLKEGMISQTKYEEAVLSYEKTKLSAKELLNQYTDLKELLDRPYLISTQGGI